MSSRTLHEHVQATYGALDRDYTPFKGHHRDLQMYLQPRRGRWQVDESGMLGSKKHQKILNGTGTYALRALSSGMTAGLTSPARPWIKLITRDPQLRDYRPVREWLQACTRVLQVIFQRSNIYDTLPKVYTEMGFIGQGPYSVLPDPESVITTKMFTVGRYRIAQNDKGIVDTFYRKFPMTVRQVVEKFGLASKSLTGEGASNRVERLWDRGDKYERIPVIQAVEPNNNNDYMGAGESPKASPKSLPIRSVYIEDGEESVVLEHTGHDRMPIMAPRWESDDDCAYATNCPGMDALGDVQQLQTSERYKNEGLSKQVNPPVKAPNSLKNAQVSLLSGHVTFMEIEPDAYFEPIYRVEPRLDHMVLDLQRQEDRIRTGLYADMFLMLYSLHDNPAMTATEIAERQSEKLLLLGPVLERINNQGLDPTIEATFQYAWETNQLPPPPPEMFGQEIGVEYVSVLAQAQRAIGVGNVERFFGFVGGLMQMDPNVRHHIDFAATVNRYGEMIGVPADVLRDAEEAEEAIAAEQRQMAMASATEQAATGAGAAKDLAAASTSDGDNMLDRVLQGVGAP